MWGFEILKEKKKTIQKPLLPFDCLLKALPLIRLFLQKNTFLESFSSEKISIIFTETKRNL
jgi:hypothetical protein